jgi:ribosomal protein L37AE/L43A
MVDDKQISAVMSQFGKRKTARKKVTSRANLEKAWSKSGRPRPCPECNQKMRKEEKGLWHCPHCGVHYRVVPDEASLAKRKPKLERVE